MSGLPHRTTFSTFSNSFLRGDVFKRVEKDPWTRFRGEWSLPSAGPDSNSRLLSVRFLNAFSAMSRFPRGAGPGPVPPHRRRAGSPGGLGPRAPGAPCGPGPAPPSAAGSPLTGNGGRSPSPPRRGHPGPQRRRHRHTPEGGRAWSRKEGEGAVAMANAARPCLPTSAPSPARPRVIDSCHGNRLAPAAILSVGFFFKFKKKNLQN